MTMTAETAQPTTTTTTADQRADALRVSLDAEPANDDAGEPTTETEAAPPEAPAEVAETAPAVDPKVAERRARIEAMKAKERAADEERQARRASREKDGEAEKLRQRLADLEPLNDVFKSEEALLEAAEKRGLTADKLVQWMRTRLSDPALVAKREAQTEAEKLRAEMAADRKALEALKAELAEERKAAAERAEGMQKAQAFFTAIQASADTYPLTAGLLQRKGAEGLVAFANKHIITEMPEGYSVEELHDALEQHLDDIGARPYVPTAAKATQPKRSGAAKPADTLSNDVESDRATVSEEIPLHRLSGDERVARLKERLARE